MLRKTRNAFRSIGAILVGTGNYSMTGDLSLSYWPNGYYEPGYIAPRGNTVEDITATMIAPHAAHKALEIGAGGGTWTSILAGLFASVTAVDIVPQTSSFRTYGARPNVQYVIVDGSGALPAADAELDYVWSYDVFCHLPFATALIYFKEIARCLKFGKHAGIMFSCRERHPDRVGKPGLARNVRDESYWFDYSIDDIAELAEVSGLKVANRDVFIANRDRLVLFVKA